jgi:hypothetical protein
MGTEIDCHSGPWKIKFRMETTSSGGNLTAASLVADYQVRDSSNIIANYSLPDSVWNIPSDGVIQIR